MAGDALFVSISVLPVAVIAALLPADGPAGRVGGPRRVAESLRVEEAATNGRYPKHLADGVDWT